MATTLGAWDWIYMFLSFIFVLFLLFVTLYFIKRMNNINIKNSKHGASIHVIQSISLGGKQKILLIRVNNNDILIGVTLNNINKIASWKSPKDIDDVIKENNMLFDETNGFKKIITMINNALFSKK